MTRLLLPPRRWTLRARLLSTLVALLAVVCLVVGGAVTLALREFLYQRLDKQVTDATSLTVGRYNDDGGGHRPPSGGTPPASAQLAFLNGPGLPPGTVGAHIKGDVVTVGKVQPPIEQLPASLAPWFEGVPADGSVITRTIPGLGDYRLAAHVAPDGDTIVAGLPVEGVDEAVSRLVLVELVVTGGGLVVAAVVGSVLIRRNLEPLQRVAATATRVSSLPLDRGDVVLHERVPDDDADPNTEVGQVTLAINRMLGHVGRALVARQASETRVRQFVADASHELRTPLASIRGYAEFTQRAAGDLPPDAANALVRVRSQTERMADLVDDLLLLARLDSGRPLARNDVDFSRLLADAVGDAHVAGRDHTWLLELPEEPVAVPGDAARLQQVVGNLLANARTHTPPGTRVRTALTTDGADAVLTVSDDGPGIPATLLPDVFERFARGDDSRTRGAGSTGLGLAIVAAVVEAHHGSVAVTSEPGATVFTVRLPLSAEPENSSTATIRVASTAEA
ncbi:MAG TPA: ATP-binding protein [Kineosporiaceae bacterium]|nr:ATP-binding protein [Kineosporiaceae bacterium]